MRTTATRPALLLAAALALSPLGEAAARDLPVDGPLGIAIEGPVRQLYLDVTGADARTPDGPRLSARWVISNSWTTPTTFWRRDEVARVQYDAQADAIALAARFPWTALWPGGADVPAVGAIVRRLTSSLEARATVWWGGWSDAPVEGWHKLIGFTNFQRGPYPQHDVRLVLENGHATGFDVQSTRLSFGGVVLRNQLLLAEGGSSLRADPGAKRSRWAVSARLDLKVPVGSPSGLGSSGGTDVGVGLLATAEVRRWLVLHGQVFTAVWGDASSDDVMKPRRFHQGGELSAVFAGRRWAVIVEDRLLSPLYPGDWNRFGAEGYDPLQASATFPAVRWHNQISGGIRRGGFTAWFSEDFSLGETAGTKRWFYNSNAPDISVGLEYARGL